jgi:hypothetical protein
VNGAGLVRAAIEEAELNSPRAQQIESGASQTFGCRAESLLRLTGVPQSNPRVGLSAVVGKAVHAYLEQVVTGPDNITERRYTYRDVRCTVDLIRVASKALRDYKSTTTDKLAAIVHDGPKRSHRGQIHLGAAAAREAGIDIETVGLIYIPRDSNDLDDIWEWSEPFSQTFADEAADWHADQRARAEQAAELKADPTDWLNGLRDEPLHFCEQFCPFVDLCRGPEPAQPADDPELIELAHRYMTAKLEADEAYARVRYYKEQLDQAPPIIVDGYKLAWSGGKPQTKTVVDVEELKRAFEMFVGDVPVITESTVTARSYRMTKARRS